MLPTGYFIEKLTERYRDIEVIAITTAGARVNAVAAGDLASYYEINADYRYDLDEDSDNNQKVLIV